MSSAMAILSVAGMKFREYRTVIREAARIDAVNAKGAGLGKKGME
jgi:hypothetical protein